MKHLIRTSTFLALTALVVYPAMAQQRGGRGGRGAFGGPGGGMQANADMIMLSLLRNESIQEEVEISPDQLEKITSAGEKMRENAPDFRGLRDASAEEREKMMAEMRSKMEEGMKEIRKEIQATLSEPQLKRLNEIAIQMMGTSALSDPKVVEKLGITEEQKEKMKTIQDETRNAIREIFQSGARDQAREKMAEAREQEQEKVMGVLTGEQKTKFEEMKGTPSDAVKEMQAQGGRGGFGGGFGRGGQGGGRGGRGGDRNRPEAE